MSVALQQQSAPPTRRVRHEVRDALAVACFSAGASVAVALSLLVLITLVGQPS